MNWALANFPVNGHNSATDRTCLLAPPGWTLDRWVTPIGWIWRLFSDPSHWQDRQLGPLLRINVSRREVFQFVLIYKNDCWSKSCNMQKLSFLISGCCVSSWHYVLVAWCSGCDPVPPDNYLGWWRSVVWILHLPLLKPRLVWHWFLICLSRLTEHIPDLIKQNHAQGSIYALVINWAMIKHDFGLRQQLINETSYKFFSLCPLLSINMQASLLCTPEWNAASGQRNCLWGAPGASTLCVNASTSFCSCTPSCSNRTVLLISLWALNAVNPLHRTLMRHLWDDHHNLNGEKTLSRTKGMRDPG
jgi:hypothetical protein